MSVSKKAIQVIICIGCLLISIDVFSIDIKPDACSTFGSDPNWAYTEDCKECARMQNAPDYYCDCHASGNMYFGIDTIITDTTWLRTSLTEVLEKGVMAYWFSDNGIGIDFYVNCIQIAPYISARVGANKSYGMDSKDIKSKIEEAGLGSVVSRFDAYFRFYPLNGKPGRVIGLEYNTGFHSTCDSLFQVYYNMVYPFSYTDNVYELKPKDMKQDFFVQWKQEREKGKDTEVDLAITWGDCMGDTVATAHLFDSTKVYFPERHLLDSARTAGQSLYFHFQSTGLGNLKFVSPVRWMKDTLHYEFCEGMTIELKDTVLRETTVYTDTTWLKSDTCMLTTYDVTVIPPMSVDTVMYLTKDELPHYFNGWKRLNAFGNYTIIDNSAEGEACAVIYNLQLIEDVKAYVARTDDNFALLAQTYLPAGADVQVQIPQNGQLQVVDMLGRVLYTQVVSCGEHTLKITDQGQYMVRLVAADKVFTQRVIVW